MIMTSAESYAKTLGISARKAALELRKFSHAKRVQLLKKLAANLKLAEKKILAANTSMEALQHCQAQGLDLAAAVCAAALEKTRAVVPLAVELEVWAVDREGNLLACAREYAA